ncbi:hypothetical protein HFP57_13565 [Parasphingopyxis algicola]|uniref:TPM domain-containing protein n=1 Tax=Parasphingopyxis algicola TaxID=2026624 RepID=UPI0015A27648|nr:TPM domain-containing protein [Parasphingopyxis algicola]QLC25950.1 hypothetical protein HFP57_13565 [Parasphingopyxis algicola]
MRYRSPIAITGMALALAACSGSAGGDAEAAGAATVDEAAVAEDGREGPIDYVKDIGLLEEGMDAQLNERLAAFHAETGHEVHIAVILSTDDTDIEQKAAEMVGERGIGAGGALILIAAADEAIAIVPATGAHEALTREFTDATESEMAAHFDAGEVSEGFDSAVDALTARLGGVERIAAR